MRNKNNHVGGHKCCGWFSKYRHQTLRTFFGVLVVLGFVFTFSVGIETARALRERKDAIRFAKAGYYVEKAVGGYRILPRLIYKSKAEQRPVSVYGEILSVESNKITILNNGATEQVVLSLPETKITLGENEVGISALKAKQEGTFTGFYNKDNQLEVRMIKL